MRPRGRLLALHSRAPHLRALDRTPHLRGPRLTAAVLTALLAAACGVSTGAPAADPGSPGSPSRTAAAAAAPITITTTSPTHHSAGTTERRARPVAATRRTGRSLSRAAGLRVALTGTAGGPSAAAPCGQVGTPPPTYQHVIWIWLENRSYGTVIGGAGSAARRQAPYLNSLADSCGLATNYHNISHPSQPNYFAAVAGTTGDVTTNCEPSTCSLANLDTLFTQVTASGREWRSYEESMPAPCVTGNSGEYVDRHNPEVYFSADRAQCRAWDVPMGTAGHGAFVDALDGNSLPAFSFVTPNVCTDMHSCPTDAGDRWLSRWVPRILDSPGYRDGSTALFVTFDEGEGGHTYDCATNTTDVGCHVPTIVVSPSTPAGTRSDELFNHYSLLKTTEQLLGLPALLGHAGDPATQSMSAAFGL